jgi:hypothetical protein
MYPTIAALRTKPHINSGKVSSDRALAQAVSRRTLTAEAQIDIILVNTGFMVDKVTLGKIFSLSRVTLIWA